VLVPSLAHLTHRVVCEVLPSHVPVYNIYITNLMLQIFLQDLENQNLDMSNIYNVNSAYDHFSKCFNEVAGKHASFKERNILPKQVPLYEFRIKTGYL
jgi:hypothetical protein